MRVPYQTMYDAFCVILIKKGYDVKEAALSAELFVNASRDGVYTHGLNRFVKFIDSINLGLVDIHAKPELKESIGIIERYNGHRGAGNLNAHYCMSRAIELAKLHALGCTALANTNHWMRPGNYGLMAVEQNCIGILWTNTSPNMPPWGGKDAILGNNPVVLAVPHKNTPVIVDMAMSMFSNGKLETYARSGKELPVAGGYDETKHLTKNASDILKSKQSLPIGYWKGSGLSLALDLIAATVSGGYTTRMIRELSAETGLSQMFLAIDLDSFPDRDLLLQNIDDTLTDLKRCAPLNEADCVRFPGENMMKIRAENMEKGIPVEESIWNRVLELL